MGVALLTGANKGIGFRAGGPVVYLEGDGGLRW